MSFHWVLFPQQVRLEKLKLPSVVVFIITMCPNIWTGDVSACLPTLLMFHLLTFQKHFFINQLNKVKELTYVPSGNGDIFNFLWLLWNPCMRFLSTADKNASSSNDAFYVSLYYVWTLDIYGRVDTQSSVLGGGYWCQTKN